VRRQFKPQKARFRVAIVGDGQTEHIYFSNVRDTDRPDNFAIFPDSPRKIGTYKGVLDKAVELMEDYDNVYALIDMDKVIQDSRQQAYSAYKKAAETKGIIVLENNPCFEIWLLLHFTYTTKLFANCDDVADVLRKDWIKGYSKSEKFIYGANLYKTYKDHLQSVAIPNAKRLELSRDDQDQLFPRAQIFQFFEWYFSNVK
jgi:hypothetical protein